MRIRLLGSMAIDGAPAALSRRDRVVLTRLALCAGRVVSRDALTDALWAGTVPPSAGKVVQGTIVRLRRRLGANTIETTSAGYRLNLPAAEVDVLQFKDLVTRARDLAKADAAERAALIAGQALALWPAGVELEWDATDLHEQLQLTAMRDDVEEEYIELQLRTRGGADLVEGAAALVDAAPQRERRWALLARAQYRVGRQAEALRTIHDARRTLRAEVGLELGRELVELERQILDHDLELEPTAAQAELPDGPECPYRGLLAFDVADRDVFYGRERAVRDALTKLAQTGALVIVGASGSGKSSLLRAGVVASLRAEGRSVEFVERGWSGKRWSEFLDCLPDGTVLAADQFEELLVAAPDGERVDDLLALQRWANRGTLLLTLRSDHLDRLVEQPWLAALAERSLLLLGQLDVDDLRSAIVGPAAACGLRLEPGLVELVIRDVGGEPGALPLMSHALRATWHRREGRVLTVDAYERAGGLQGAIATTAESVYADLLPSDRERMRRLMLGLFDTSLERRPMRLRMSIDAARNEAGGQDSLDRLSSARLVVVGDQDVTVAHEAMAIAWPRLATWLDDDREAARQRRHLAESARAWDEMGRPDAELYRGARLAAVVEHFEMTGHALPPVEAEFLSASRRHDAADRSQVETELVRRRLVARRMRWLVATLVAVTFVAASLGTTAIVQSRRASSEQQRAEVAAARAQREALLASADALLDSERDVAVLLAAEADRLQSDLDSRSALLRAFTDSVGLLGYRWFVGPSAALDIVAVDDGRVAVLDDRLGVWLVSTSVAAGEAVRLSDQTGTGTGLLALDPERLRLAAYRDSGNGAASIDIYDIATRRHVTALPVPAGRTSLAVSADGKFIALAGGASTSAAVYDGADGSRVGTVPTPLVEPQPDPLRSAAVAFGGNDTLYVSTMRGTVDEYRVPDLAPIGQLAAVQGSAPPTGSLTVVDDGATLLATGRQFGPIQGKIVARWDLHRHEPVWSVAPRSQCAELAYLPAADAVYCSFEGGALEALDAANGTTIATFATQLGSASAVTATPDGRHFIVASGSDPVIAVFDTAGGGPITTVDVASARHDSPAAYAADGSRLLTNVIPGSPSDPPDAPFRVPHLVDTTTAAVSNTLEQILAAAWLENALAFASEGGYGILDPSTGTTIPIDASGFTGEPASTTTDPHGGRLLVFFADDSIRLIDAAGNVTVVPLHIPWPTEAAFIDDDRVAIVGADRDLSVVDIATGRTLAGPASQYESVNVGPHGLIAGDRDGRVHTLDPSDLHDLAVPFLVGDGPVYDVHLDRDATVLAARTATAVRLFDVATWQPLGGSIPVARADFANGSALRPDGLQLAVTNAAGLALWNLDHSAWLAGACQLAGRNLTHQEWTTYLPGLDYHQTCPEFPTPAP